MRKRPRGAKWMILYHGTELEPNAFPNNPDDYGIFERTGEVRGTRSYGRGDRRRQAYCDGIFAWAGRTRYPVAIEDPSTPARESPC